MLPLLKETLDSKHLVVFTTSVCSQFAPEEPIDLNTVPEAALGRMLHLAAQVAKLNQQGEPNAGKYSYYNIPSSDPKEPRHQPYVITHIPSSLIPEE